MMTIISSQRASLTSSETSVQPTTFSPCDSLANIQTHKFLLALWTAVIPSSPSTSSTFFCKIFRSPMTSSYTTTIQTLIPSNIPSPRTTPSFVTPRRILMSRIQSVMKPCKISRMAIISSDIAFQQFPILMTFDI